jgi:hypothetical protein
LFDSSKGADLSTCLATVNSPAHKPIALSGKVEGQFHKKLLVLRVAAFDGLGYA